MGKILNKDQLVFLEQDNLDIIWKVIGDDYCNRVLDFPESELQKLGPDSDMNKFGNSIESSHNVIGNFKKENGQLYILTNTAKDVIKKIKWNKTPAKTFSKFPFNCLKIGYSSTQYYKYVYDIENDIMQFIKIWDDPESRKLIDSGHMGVVLNYSIIFIAPNRNVYLIGDDPEEHNTMEEYIRLTTFLEYSDLETVHLKPNQKYGTRKNGYYNATNNDFTIVDSTWNKIIIRDEGFKVSGHFRLQPYGQKNSKRKLIYIKPFMKNGYFRNAPKLNKK